MEVVIISGILTFLGIVASNIFQIVRERKKTNAEIVDQLIDRALQVSKHEFETMRELNTNLETKVDKLETRLDSKEKEIEALRAKMDALEEENDLLRKELEKCVKEEK